MYPRSVTARGLEISPPLALAPMVGLTHTALRTVTQRLGGVGVLYTEMLAARRVPHDTPRHSPLLARSEEESPLIYQLACSAVELIGPAVEKLHRLRAQGVDLNLGCPAPMQKKQGAGAALVDNPGALTDILGALRRSTELPVSAKIRLGHRVDEEKLADFCRYLEDQGVDLITIHARLIGEKFCRKPRWRDVAAARRGVGVPIFVNGGIFTVEDARRCLEQSEADGLMIGRGAVERPWLPREISSALYGTSPSSKEVDKREIYFTFVTLLEERIREEKQLRRLKLFTRYYANSFAFGHHLASAVVRSHSMSEAKESAAEFFSRLD